LQVSLPLPILLSLPSLNISPSLFLLFSLPIPLSLSEPWSRSMFTHCDLSHFLFLQSPVDLCLPHPLSFSLCLGTNHDGLFHLPCLSVVWQAAGWLVTAHHVQ
jgi:hypothetical protein